jgi:hypothetical protein
MALATGSSIAIALSPSIGLYAPIFHNSGNVVLKVCPALLDSDAFKARGELDFDIFMLVVTVLKDIP